MADYPSIEITDKTSINPRGGLLPDEAEDGTIRTRDIAAAVNYDITIVHEYATSAERTTLLAHYAANKGGTFNWTAPWGDSYTLRYLDAPGEQPLSGDYWNLTSRLTGTKV